jgi:hypothetical protein
MILHDILALESALSILIDIRAKLEETVVSELLRVWTSAASVRGSWGQRVCERAVRE